MKVYKMQSENIGNNSNTLESHHLPQMDTQASTLQQKVESLEPVVAIEDDLTKRYSSNGISFLAASA